MSLISIVLETQLRLCVEHPSVVRVVRGHNQVEGYLGTISRYGKPAYMVEDGSFEVKFDLEMVERFEVEKTYPYYHIILKVN